MKIVLILALSFGLGQLAAHGIPRAEALSCPNDSDEIYILQVQSVEPGSKVSDEEQAAAAALWLPDARISSDGTMEVGVRELDEDPWTEWDEAGFSLSGSWRADP